jgi:succinoglycan biosynthesis protein ExoO
MASPIAKAIAVGDDDHLLFVGSNTGPNIAGLQWFIDTVWPVVKAVRPGVRLDVAGTVGWSFAGNNARDVRFLGMVDDLGALYERAGVVISPLTFGSGLKIKLVEAMARGKAVVATPVTLQGVEDEVDGAVVRAETADEFAAGVVALTGDAPARTALAEAALACARAHFGRTTAHASFAAWLAADQSEAGMR